MTNIKILTSKTEKKNMNNYKIRLFNINKKYKGLGINSSSNKLNSVLIRLRNRRNLLKTKSIITKSGDSNWINRLNNLKILKNKDKFKLQLKKVYIKKLIINNQKIKKLIKSLNLTNKNNLNTNILNKNSNRINNFNKNKNNNKNTNINTNTNTNINTNTNTNTNQSLTSILNFSRLLIRKRLRLKSRDYLRNLIIRKLTLIRSSSRLIYKDIIKRHKNYLDETQKEISKYQLGLIINKLNLINLHTSLVKSQKTNQNHKNNTDNNNNNSLITNNLGITTINKKIINMNKLIWPIFKNKLINKLTKTKILIIVDGTKLKEFNNNLKKYNKYISGSSLTVSPITKLSNINKFSLNNKLNWQNKLMTKLNFIYLIHNNDTNIINKNSNYIINLHLFNIFKRISFWNRYFNMLKTKNFFYYLFLIDNYNLMNIFSVNSFISNNSKSNLKLVESNNSLSNLNNNYIFKLNGLIFFLLNLNNNKLFIDSFVQTVSNKIKYQYESFNSIFNKRYLELDKEENYFINKNESKKTIDLIKNNWLVSKNNSKILIPKLNNINSKNNFIINNKIVDSTISKNKKKNKHKRATKLIKQINKININKNYLLQFKLKFFNTNRIGFMPNITRLEKLLLKKKSKTSNLNLTLIKYIYNKEFKINNNLITTNNINTNSNKKININNSTINLYKNVISNFIKGNNTNYLLFIDVINKYIKNNKLDQYNLFFKFINKNYYNQFNSLVNLLNLKNKYLLNNFSKSFFKNMNKNKKNYKNFYKFINDFMSLNNINTNKNNKYLLEFSNLMPEKTNKFNLNSNSLFNNDFMNKIYSNKNLKLLFYNSLNNFSFNNKKNNDIFNFNYYKFLTFQSSINILLRDLNLNIRLMSESKNELKPVKDKLNNSNNTSILNNNSNKNNLNNILINNYNSNNFNFNNNYNIISYNNLIKFNSNKNFFIKNFNIFSNFTNNTTSETIFQLNNKENNWITTYILCNYINQWLANYFLITNNFNLIKSNNNYSSNKFKNELQNVNTKNLLDSGLSIINEDNNIRIINTFNYFKFFYNNQINYIFNRFSNPIYMFNNNKHNFKYQNFIKFNNGSQHKRMINYSNSNYNNFILSNNHFSIKNPLLLNKSLNKTPLNITSLNTNINKNKHIYINKFIKNMNIQGSFIYLNKFIGYNFNHNTNNFIKDIYDILFFAFKSMSCLISKPIFTIKNDKIIIHLFYYLVSPAFLRFRRHTNTNNISLGKIKSNKTPLLQNSNQNKTNILYNYKNKINSKRIITNVIKNNIKSNKLNNNNNYNISSFYLKKNNYYNITKLHNYLLKLNILKELIIYFEIFNKLTSNNNNKNFKFKKTIKNSFFSNYVCTLKNKKNFNKLNLFLGIINNKKFYSIFKLLEKNGYSLKDFSFVIKKIKKIYILRLRLYSIYKKDFFNSKGNLLKNFKRFNRTPRVFTRINNYINLLKMYTFYNNYKYNKTNGYLNKLRIRLSPRMKYNFLKNKKFTFNKKWIKIKFKRKKNIIQDYYWNLNSTPLTTIFPEKFDALCYILSKYFNKPVELKLIRVHYPYSNTNILVNFLGLFVNKVKINRVVRKLFKSTLFKNIFKNKFNNFNSNRINKFKVVKFLKFWQLKKKKFRLNLLNNKNKVKIIKFNNRWKLLVKNNIKHNNNNLNSDTIIPAFLTGMNIKIAGRLLKQKIRPRYSVTKFKKGINSRGNSNYIDFARFTGVNKRGAYSISINSSQNFFNQY